MTADMMSSKLAIVYIAYEYPPVTQTFVLSEAMAVQEIASDVHLYPLNFERRSGSGSPRGGVQIADRRALIGPNFFAHLIPSVAMAVRNWRCLGKQLLLPPYSLHFRLRAIKALYLGFLLAMYARNLRRPVHLHAHFFGLMSEVAIIARYLMPDGTTLSIAGHAADVVSPTSRRRLLIESDTADFVACASQFVRASLRASGSVARALTIRCGVDVREGLADRYRRGDELQILTVARLVDKKGIEDCLNAAALLKSEGRLVFSWRIVGDGPLRESLELLRRALGLEELVHFDGIQSPERVKVLLANHTDVFVLPCRSTTSGDVDGIPVSLMEAMAAFLPVVTTQAGGIAELVCDRVTGYIVPERSPSAIASVLTEVATSPSASLGISQAGHEYVKENFSRTDQAMRLVREIRGLDTTS